MYNNSINVVIDKVKKADLVDDIALIYLVLKPLLDPTG